MDEFLPHLAAWRARKGLTQAELAERAGVERANLSRFEHQHLKARLRTVVRLAEALGIDTDDLRQAPPKSEK